ncbi:hypothetical protein DSO57_1004379 [Entomophthora muscae]|uniref:Uncharacterized protein n=1 Tax=Entomophthora muscae TaxID=34485 RepID=A0ACC2U6H7_9FUNG|nr:hypothetical protein DSO57_1004379 [Entomophthora muscae]
MVLQVKDRANCRVEELRNREEKSVKIMACWRDDNKVLSHKIAFLEAKLLKALSQGGNGNKSQGQYNGKFDWLDLDTSQENYNNCQASAGSQGAKRSPVLVEFSKEAAEVADTVFKNISVLLPLQTVYKEFPGLRCIIEKWDKELAKAQDILVVLPPFSYPTTCVEISIQKLKIKAILDTGSPANVVSPKLVKKLKLLYDLKYHQLYGTSGLSMTHAIGTYSALPMQFGKLLLATPAVVLENESYNLLAGSQFLRE